METNYNKKMQTSYDQPTNTKEITMKKHKSLVIG